MLNVMTLPLDRFELNLREAHSMVERGWFPIPLCWPSLWGSCQCGWNHLGGAIGKAPIAGRNYQDLIVTHKHVADWWARKPFANIGLLLDPSDLVVLDLDGEEAVKEAESYGIPETLSVCTGKGKHYYFERPDDWPSTRITGKGCSKHMDILSKGYVVAPPSVHASGRVYRWEDKSKELASPPRWMRRYLPSKPLRKHELDKDFESNHADVDVVRAALNYLESETYDVWLHVGFSLQAWDDEGNGRGRGFMLWDEWSQGSSKYPGAGKLEAKWKSFRRQRGAIGLGTLFHSAKEEGWSPFKPYTPVKPPMNWRSIMAQRARKDI